MPTIRKTSVKIQGFADLRDGWAYGSGKAIRPLAINLALRFNAYAQHLGFISTNAFPGEDGGVQFVIYDEQQENETEYEFNINPNGEIDFAYIVAGYDKDFKECLSFNSAISKLEECVLDLCDLPASFTQTTTMKRSVVSEVQPLPHPTMVVYQSLISTVQKPQVAHYVTTSISSIPTTLEALQQSFGKSQSTIQPC